MQQVRGSQRTQSPRLQGPRMSRYSLSVCPGILTSVPAPAPCRSLALVSDDVDVDVVPRARFNDLAVGDGDVERYSHVEFLLDAGIVIRSPQE